jgi:hypothetical protein
MYLPCSRAAKSSAQSVPCKVGYYVLIEDSATFLCIIGPPAWIVIVDRSSFVSTMKKALLEFDRLQVNYD